MADAKYLSSNIPHLTLKSGRPMPRFGLGTWCMGENRSTQGQEVQAIAHGIESGITLIDTAEMYGEGGAEQVMASAISPHREQLYLVSKVYPHNASYKGVIAACDRSLSRLNTDYLDLYLLHWRGSYPLAETFQAFHDLKEAGKIRDFGVSNFDVADMEEAIETPYGNEIVVNQVLYNLSRRGIEWDLIPWCKEHRIAIMAYSPLEQGRILKNARLNAIAKRHQASPAQIAIAWVMRQPNIITIPKSAQPKRINENIAALKLKLSSEDMALLDEAFPAPTRKMSLGIL